MPSVWTHVSTLHFALIDIRHLVGSSTQDGRPCFANFPGVVCVRNLLRTPTVDFVESSTQKSLYYIAVLLNLLHRTEFL